RRQESAGGAIGRQRGGTSMTSPRDARPLRRELWISMRAIQLTGLHQPLQAVTLPDPEPGPGEVLVRIRACGICHSDAHYRQGFGRLTLPRTPGHEVAGVVERVGAGVALAEGTRVA